MMCVNVCIIIMRFRLGCVSRVLGKEMGPNVRGILVDALIDIFINLLIIIISIF